MKEKRGSVSLDSFALRLLEIEELGWANQYYRSAGLQQSNDDTLVYVLESEGKPIGLGRIIPVNSQCGELSAVHLFNEYRGLGLAPILMQMMLDVSPYKWLFSIAYTEHTHLYMNAGFQLVTNYSSAPEPVIKKYQWCLDNLPHPVQMLELRRT